MTSPSRLWLRFVPAALLIGGTALYLHGRGQSEGLPPRKELAGFPMRVGNWNGVALRISPEVREVLGPGDYIERIYESDQGSLDLFLAYFPSQRTGDTIHSPKNCLPGNGWAPVEAARMQLALPGGRAITVNHYVIGKGLDRQVVLYWYQAHGRVEASEYAAKFYLVADAIRLHRTDGSLVRIITPVADGESLDRGQGRAAQFAEQILPVLDDYIPR